MSQLGCGSGVSGADNDVSVLVLLECDPKHWSKIVFSVTTGMNASTCNSLKGSFT